MRSLPSVLLVMPVGTRRRLFTAQLNRTLETLASEVRWVPTFRDPAIGPLLRDAEVIITSWGSGQLTGDLLARAPRLRAVLHAAGSVRAIVSDTVWQRGITVSSATDANAIPVAEFTLASIIYAGKRARSMEQAYRRLGKSGALRSHPDASNHHRTIGLIGLGRIGRRVADLLQILDCAVVAHDPYATDADADRYKVQLVSLDELMRRSDIVSVHAPNLPSTHKMIGGEQLALMPDGATLINTARPAIIDTEALTAELVSGRIHAVLDVTDPEPLPADSVLFTLPNVQVTPHIAGALGSEVQRLAELALGELERFTRDEPLHHQILEDDLDRVA